MKLVTEQGLIIEPVTSFIGIDPGVSGGVALLSGENVRAWSMPDDERSIWQLMHGLDLRNSFACIEQVGGWVGSHQRKEGDDGRQSNPGSAMFTFGQSYGALRMCLVALGVPFEVVRPQEWQRVIGVKRQGEDTTRWKSVLKAEAQCRFGNIRVTKKIADSLLIADYCRIRWNNII